MHLFYTNDNIHIHSSSVYTLNPITSPTRHSLHTHHLLQGEEDPVQHSLAQAFNIPNKHPLDSCTTTPTARFPGLPPLRLPRSPVHSRTRSLIIHPAPPYDDYDEMTAVTEAPGSPPGLTASKSSKSSSSFHSTSLSGAEGILSDIAHFEDIGLGEDQSQFGQNINGMEKSTRPAPRATTTVPSRHKGSGAAMSTMRELTNQSQSAPKGQGLAPIKVHSATHSLSLPYGTRMGRSLRNSSTPSLAITAMSNRNRSRSPSPVPAFSTSSPAPKAIPSPKSPRRPGLAPINVQVRRPAVRSGSWQSNRKSVKELEAEYNDADEDLPDDASLWNVPLSPRPPAERGSISAAQSTKNSPSTSPERPSPLRSSTCFDSAQTLRTAPSISEERNMSNGFSSPPYSPKKATLMRGASTGTMPDHFGLRNKSWNVAMSELSEEAKVLTETLENHAAAEELQHEEAVQGGEAPTNATMEKLSRSKSSAVVLPPLRINNVMIDPLPVSKEKEKLLSRTRPSWLPPKSKKEEKKHLREYRRMMESSLEAERRMAAKIADNQCANDNTKKSLLRIWEEHVLPNWNQAIREPRTRELWWRGVAPKSRAQVWTKAIGNDLALTEVTYDKALKRAKDIERTLFQSGSETFPKEKAWFDAIQRDVKVTMVELNIFQPNAPLHDGLVDVLMAYSMYRSDVGYSHGTHLTAALLFLTLPTPSQVFLCLSNLLNRPLPLAFLTGDPAATSKAYNLTLSLLQRKYPRLYAHLFGDLPPPGDILNGLGITSPTVGSEPLTGLGIASPTLHTSGELSSTPSLRLSPHQVLEPMMRTLFLGPGDGLGVDIAARVWDVMVFDGDAAIIRTAVAVLGSLEGKLYGGKEEVLNVLGWRGNIGRNRWDVGGEESFMTHVREVGKEANGL